MNRNYNENYNNKYNLDPKYIKCAGCPKPAQLRSDGNSHVIAYKGRNNEELCCKCTKNICQKCGRQEKLVEWRKGERNELDMPFFYEKDENNPSGEWIVYQCSRCNPGEIERVKLNNPGAERWEIKEIKSGSSQKEGKPNPSADDEWEKYQRLHHQAQNYWNLLSKVEREKELVRVVENMKVGKYWANNATSGNTHFGSYWEFDAKTGKFNISQSTYDVVPIQIVEEFLKKEFGKISNELVLRIKDYYRIVIVDGDSSAGKQGYNSPSPNPSAPQPITNSNDKSDNSVNPSNSPKPNPGKDNNLSETKNNVKTIWFENKENENKDKPANSNENSPAKNDDKLLVIDLKNVKWISLTAEGNLVIEFKSEKSENNSEIGAIQKITAKEINNNQELQKVKDYFQKTGKSSLNQQELNSLIQNKTGSAPVNSTENPGHSKAVWISVSVGISLTIGIVIGLLMKRKKQAKKIR